MIVFRKAEVTFVLLDVGNAFADQNIISALQNRLAQPLQNQPEWLAEHFNWALDRQKSNNILLN